ncbi:hypothetical protein [Thiohalorhabdus sp.]|uniref:hypothetical protein n=1 Tax=Thiohalorhabdus sp. TaxID=3094134 RepID=UPI002FC2B8E7
MSLGLRFLAGALVVTTGLYVAGWWPGVARLKHLGLPVWRRLEPRGRNQGQPVLGFDSGNANP